MLVPVGREGVQDAWCEVTGRGCSRLEDPRRDYDGASGWRQRLDPDEAASWGNYIALGRSEEHTSELQSRGHLVCRLLLEKKKSVTKTMVVVRLSITSESKKSLISMI